MSDFAHPVVKCGENRKQESCGFYLKIWQDIKKSTNDNQVI